MAKHRLLPHPLHPPRGIVNVEVAVDRPTADRLELGYWLFGEMDDLRLPAPAAPLRADGLWQTTCCEAFLREGGASSYREFNFSPSTEWAAYDLGRYRDPDKTDADLPASPEVGIMLHRANRLLLAAGVSLPLGEKSWRVGLSVVVEERDGTKSYWALAHPADQPDFHHRDSFALELPPAK